MSQITIELEDILLKRLQTKAKELQIGLEGYISKLVRKAIKPKKYRSIDNLDIKWWTEKEAKEFEEVVKDFVR